METSALSFIHRVGEQQRDDLFHRMADITRIQAYELRNHMVYDVLDTLPYEEVRNVALAQLRSTLTPALEKELTETELTLRHFDERFFNRTYVNDTILPVVVRVMERAGVVDVDELPPHVREILETTIKRALIR
jgi:hypothetical protein